MTEHQWAEPNNEPETALVPVPVEPLGASSAADQPALVVDLPDGQKIVIGQLPAGVAIEVATWRGTGRPDSRTHRLLLGISDSGKPAHNEAATAPRVSSDSPVPADVTASPTSAVVESSDTSFEDEDAQPKRRGASKWWLAAAATVFAGYAVFAFLGLRVAHPANGVQAGLGSAESSMVVTQPVDALAVGDLVIVQNASGQLVLGSINSIAGDAVLVAAGSGYVQASQTDVTGKVLFVVPFVGTTAGWFGQ